MSKILVKLIDYALLPASLLVVGKFLGLLFAINIFNLDWGIKNIPGSLFSVRPVFYSEDIILASTYSDLIMFIIMTIGFSFILIQAVYFHNTHVSPRTLMKLASYNLLGLIKSTFEVYHQAAIWSIFIWVVDLLILFNVLTSKTEVWVFVFSCITSLILTVLLLRDVSKEIEISKKSPDFSMK